jgi:hypothetical protein
MPEPAPVTTAVRLCACMGMLSFDFDRGGQSSAALDAAGRTPGPPVADGRE